MHTSLFQAPFNQVSVRIVGDETAPSLFRLDSQNVVRVISGADLQRDPTRVYKVSILYLCAVWSLTPDQLSSCRAGIVSMPILRSSCSGMLCCLKEDIVFFFLQNFALVSILVHHFFLWRSVYWHLMLVSHHWQPLLWERSLSHGT